MRHRLFHIAGPALLALALVPLSGVELAAQGRGGGGEDEEVETPQAGAPIDLEGYWVSIVNEDWRWRMVTPPRGDFASVPLNDEGERVGMTWEPEMDGACQAYGVGGLMRIPTRLRVTWADPNTLQIETDAGSQKRRLHFEASGAPTERSLQGRSVAEWLRLPRQGRGAEAVQPPGGTLSVRTDTTSGGWLRKNGVPYSEDATIDEYFDRMRAPNGDEWLVVTTIVTDPTYLNQPFITSTHFKREALADAPAPANWDPTTCRSL